MERDSRRASTRAACSPSRKHKPTNSLSRPLSPQTPPPPPRLSKRIGSGAPSGRASSSAAPPSATPSGRARPVRQRHVHHLVPADGAGPGPVAVMQEIPGPLLYRRRQHPRRLPGRRAAGRVGLVQELPAVVVHGPRGWEMRQLGAWWTCQGRIRGVRGVVCRLRGCERARHGS